MGVLVCELCFPHYGDKENVLYFSKSKPNCHSTVCLCLVVYWHWEYGIPHSAMSVLNWLMRYKHFRHQQFMI